MPNFKGVQAPYTPLPSKDRNKKASVDFSCGEKGGKGASWKGTASPAGAKPSERKAVISADSVRDVRNLRTSTVGAGPKG